MCYILDKSIKFVLHLHCTLYYFYIEECLGSSRRDMLEYLDVLRHDAFNSSSRSAKKLTPIAS